MYGYSLYTATLKFLTKEIFWVKTNILNLKRMTSRFREPVLLNDFINKTLETHCQRHKEGDIPSVTVYHTKIYCQCILTAQIKGLQYK